MRKIGYSRITEVRVRLKGRFPFPILNGNQSDPEIVEKEIETLVDGILHPGYPSKPNPQERLPWVFIPDLRSEYLQPDNTYLLPKEAKDRFTPMQEEKNSGACKLTIESGQGVLSLHFNDMASRERLRTVHLPHAEMEEGINHYVEKQLGIEKDIRRITADMAKHSPGDRRYEDLKGDIRRFEFARRDTHNAGSEMISRMTIERGVSLRNPKGPQDLSMRVFEMVAFLMRDGSLYPANPLSPMSRREIGRFNDVQVKLDI